MYLSYFETFVILCYFETFVIYISGLFYIGFNLILFFLYILYSCLDNLFIIEIYWKFLIKFLGN
ncbi:hypothetical protein Hdeb2414_s0003g00083861 [Helianthus debilis subsp. tardiflorus]